MTIRARLARFMDRTDVQNAIIAVIVVNAILLGMETSEVLMSRWGTLIRALDMLCLAIFVAELAAKMVAHGLRFFRNGWNIFDFIIVMS